MHIKRLRITILIFSLYTRTSKRKPHLPTIAHLVSLQLPHHQQTLAKTSELDKTHPFVFPTLLPLHLIDSTVQFLTKRSDLLLHVWAHHCHVEYLRWRITVRRPCDAFAFVLKLLLIMIQLLQDKCLVVGIEDLEIRLDVINLILSLDSTKQSLKLNQSAALLLYEDHLAHLSKIRKDIIDAAVIKHLRERSSKQYL